MQNGTQFTSLTTGAAASEPGEALPARPLRRFNKTIRTAALLSQRIEQTNGLIRALESRPDIWRRGDLLLQDAWLTGYRGLFHEEQGDIVEVVLAYKRAVKLYAMALKLDRPLAQSGPHIVSFYHLLKRYACALQNETLPAHMQDAMTLHHVVDYMKGIRTERLQQGEIDPEREHDPFANPALLLKVLFG